MKENATKIPGGIGKPECTFGDNFTKICQTIRIPDIYKEDILFQLRISGKGAIQSHEEYGDSGFIWNEITKIWNEFISRIQPKSEEQSKDELRLIRWANDGFPPIDMSKELFHVVDLINEVRRLRALLEVSRQGKGKKFYT